MKLFLNKRGDAELELTALSPLIIVLGVFIILLVYISGVGESSYFEREFLTRDIGLMLGALQASPNNVQVNYPIENSNKAKDLKIDINQKYVEAHAYNLDPKIAPSKVSRYYLFPSILPIVELNAAPKIEKDSNGKDITYSYRLYFLKDSSGITPSMDNKNSPAEKNEGYIKNMIYTAIENWYATSKVYIETMYNPGGKTGEIKGDVLLKSICSFLDRTKGEGIYSGNNCEPTIPEIRKDLVLKADYVIILYVNGEKQDSTVIDIYPVGQTGDTAAKSEKLASLLEGNLNRVSMVSSKKQIEGPLKSAAIDIASGKPAILVEIGNIDKIVKGDIKTITDAVYESVNTYYTT